MAEVYVLKIRIKFAKRGVLKFVGHLDIMRYFQKLIRRAGIDIAYSEGFNPHQKMSFAQPLGVGMLSEGEYVDIEVVTTLSSEDALKALNNASVDGISIISYKLLSENSGNAMASVKGAKYKIEFRDGYKPENLDFYNEFNRFVTENNSISVTKETKKSTQEIDLKPFIYSYDGTSDILNISVSCGSVTNIKPELVMEAFYKHLGMELNPYTFIYTRLDVYGEDDKGHLIPLEDFGSDIGDMYEQ